MTDLERAAFERALRATEEVARKLRLKMREYRSCRPKDRSRIEAEIDRLEDQQDKIYADLNLHITDGFRDEFRALGKD